MRPKINRIALDLLLAVLVFHLFSPALHAQATDDYGLKISLENQLERKLKQVIVEITGTDRVVVFVNSELSSARGGGALLEKKKQNALVLPGVPEKTEFGAGQSEVLIGAGGGKFSVNRITVSMWIDKSVPDSIVELIKDIAKNVIGFNQSRGDQIYIKKVGIAGKGLFWSSLFSLPNLFWLILTLSGAFLLGAVGMFFMDPLKKVMPALKGMDWNQIRGIKVPSTTERTTLIERGDHAAPGMLEAGTAEKDSLPFSFIRERDIGSLAFLLKDRPPQDVAIVVHYLDPGLSMRLLERLPQDKQVEVALLLSSEEVTNMEKVNTLEEMLKSRGAYVIGGENKLASILDMTNEEIRDKIFKTLETRDTRAAMRLKKRIKSLEAVIQELSAQGVQVLSRNIDAGLFAQILKSFPDEIQQKVISSLSAGAGERLKQEIDLSRPLAGMRLKREKQNLTLLIRRLISEGLVEVENNEGIEVENK